jgi:hypothetical protein
MRHRFFHHLGRLQHERQDQLAAAEFVADLFHRGQQDGVDDFDRDIMLAGGIALDDLVDIVLSPSSLAVQNAEVQPFFGVMSSRAAF